MLLDGPSDVIALTSQERTRLAELEGIVETHLEAFLATGRALCEIRNRRLFREEFGDFESYCRGRWGFSGAHGLDLVRSTSVAECLLAGPAAPETGDAPLPIDLSPDALRPLQRLQPELANSCWRLACRVGKPTGHLVGKIVRSLNRRLTKAMATPAA
jgi:hypothetical protein